MLFRSAMKLPLIVVVENNEWAISVPFSASSATETIAERAPSWSAHGIRIDGLDVELVSQEFGRAAMRARSGEGPSLIEAMCYRFRGHFEGDADMYRSNEEKENRRKQDPIAITKEKIIKNGDASAQELDDMERSVELQMNEMLESVRNDASPDRRDALRHVFAE